jgi:hypothetical protein
MLQSQSQSQSRCCLPQDTSYVGHKVSLDLVACAGCMRAISWIGVCTKSAMPYYVILDLSLDD